MRACVSTRHPPRVEPRRVVLARKRRSHHAISRVSAGAANSYEHHLYLALADDGRCRGARGSAWLLASCCNAQLTIAGCSTHGDAISVGGGVSGDHDTDRKKSNRASGCSIRADVTCMGRPTARRKLRGQRIVDRAERAAIVVRIKGCDGARPSTARFPRGQPTRRRQQTSI